VRKGVNVKRRREVVGMRNDDESRQIKAGGRTYFVDIETVQGKSTKYLRITESRMKGEGQERERSIIFVFPEAAREFAAAISEMAARLS